MSESMPTAEKDEPKRQTWRDLLEPWASQYVDLVEAIAEHCANLDDGALNALGSATHKPTQTNAWWATYHVAPLVRDVVRQEQYARHRAKEARPLPPGSSDQ